MFKVCEVEKKPELKHITNTSQSQLLNPNLYVCVCVSVMIWNIMWYAKMKVYVSYYAPIDTQQEK